MELGNHFLILREEMYKISQKKPNSLIYCVRTFTLWNLNLKYICKKKKLYFQAYVIAKGCTSGSVKIQIYSQLAQCPRITVINTIFFLFEWREREK